MASSTTNKFSPEVRDRAVRMVLAHEGEHPSRWAAMISIAGKMGCSPHTLREWVQKADRDSGRSPGISSETHEVVLINGTTVTVKVAHVRLCHSRMLFVRAYPRETQEMVFDAHDRAFAFFKGTCARGIYDNMKTAVETIFVGRERAYNVSAVATPHCFPSPSHDFLTSC
jgi:transposase-like protein